MRQVRFLLRLTGTPLDRTVRDRFFTVGLHRKYIVTYEEPFVAGTAVINIATKVGTVGLNVRESEVVLTGEKE